MTRAKRAPTFAELMSEAQLLKAVKDLANAGGWRWAHFHQTRREVEPGMFVGDTDARGWPDMVFVREGVFLVRELKAEKGGFRPGQREWLEELRGAGVDAGVWRPSDLPEIERVLLEGLRR